MTLKLAKYMIYNNDLNEALNLIEMVLDEMENDNPDKYNQRYDNAVYNEYYCEKFWVLRNLGKLYWKLKNDGDGAVSYLNEACEVAKLIEIWDKRRS